MAMGRNLLFLFMMSPGQSHDKRKQMQMVLRFIVFNGLVCPCSAHRCVALRRGKRGERETAQPASACGLRLAWQRDL